MAGLFQFIFSPFFVMLGLLFFSHLFGKVVLIIFLKTISGPKQVEYPWI